MWSRYKHKLAQKLHFSKYKPTNVKTDIIRVLSRVIFIKVFRPGTNLRKNVNYALNAKSLVDLIYTLRNYAVLGSACRGDNLELHLLHKHIFVNLKGFEGYKNDSFFQIID